MTLVVKQRKEAWHHTLGTITFNDAFAAAMFDRRSYDKPLNRQFKDLHRTGLIINRLFRQARAGDSPSAAALKAIDAHTRNKQHELDAHIAEIGVMHANTSLIQQMPKRPGVGVSFELHWDDETFLTMVKMLRDYDGAAVQLMALRDHKVIDKSLYHKLHKQLTRPIRSVLEKVFLDSKGL